MHALPDVAQKRRSHQDLLGKRSLEEREPGLINLPLPLPTIPILNPIITPIIQGNNQGSTPTSTKRTSTTNGPAETHGTGTQTTTPTDSPGNTGGGGGGSGDGGGSSETNGSSNTNDPTAPANGSSGAGSDPTHSREQNAGANPSNFPSQDADIPLVSTVFENGTPVATRTFSFSHTSPGGTNSATAPGGGSDGGNVSDGQGSDGSRSPKISAGVIAAIAIISAIIFAAIFIIARRRRYIAKRSERRTIWWNQAKKTRWSGSESLEATAGTQSARSSFATTFDHGSHFPDSEQSTPPLPPMAELRDAHASGFLLHSQPQSQVPQTPALISFDGPVEINDRRNSTFSTRSNGSDAEAQCLIAPATLAPVNPSPMSVRPFSPSESFAFPKPPASATTPATPVSTEAADPFSDSRKVVEPWAPLFFGQEVIRRPFAPTLHDEIAVSVGETVRVSKVFDDGWALVEKCPAESPNDKGKKKQIMGLIPVDCLREAGQDLSQFVASTRVSSYSAIPDTNMGTAM